MTTYEADIAIVGAGPVGLMCAYLGQLCGLRTVVVDGSAGPLQVGRADALNARTLQLLETVGLFDDLYPLGKTCNTSSVWADGKFLSRQSTWWEAIEGCFHKHFLMLGQAFVEQLLDRKLREVGVQVRRRTVAADIQLSRDGCLTTLSNGDTVRSPFVIGADGSRSFVRGLFEVPFAVVRPQLIWAVLDGVIATDFPKTPEIIVFQTDTSDVAWIPREGAIDRFYVRMDTTDFTQEQALAKINRALHPHVVRFKELTWYSQFSVKESVAERFSINNRVFLAGDACHIHSVNGGQGLNTGLGDAFNLIWKLHMALRFDAPTELLQSYEDERKPVAMSVVQSSGELVRATKHSQADTHAQDYVKVVERRAGNVTGMGIRYGDEGLGGTRVFDFMVHDGRQEVRLYSLLGYTGFTLLAFGDAAAEPFDLPPFVKVLRIWPTARANGYWAECAPYANQLLLIRPDAHIAAASSRNGVTDSPEPISGTVAEILGQMKAWPSMPSGKS